jgi:hypothetical protein
MLVHEHYQQNIIDAFMTTYDTRGKNFVVEEERLSPKKEDLQILSA